MKQSKHLKEVLAYCKDIRTGTIRSGLYTQKAVARFLNDLEQQKDANFPYEFIPVRGEEVIDFAESLSIPDMPTEDKRLQLLPWMKFIYLNLFGWVHKKDPAVRRFRSGYVEVARKNSKTTSILFPIIIYDFLTSESAESYFFSKDGAQSAKNFKELVHIIKADPELAKVAKETVAAITCKLSRIAFFSSESAGLDSYKTSCAIIDEFWDYDNDKPVTASRYGGRARQNCLVLIITSAGLDLSSPCYAENEKARKILNGLYTDETYFTIVYAYDEGDDWKDPSLFIKANPSLGTILKQEILENDLNDALISPSHQPDFKAKTCGIWTNNTSNWLSQQVIDSLKQEEPLDFTAFTNHPGYIGIDLSSVNDFTAITLCFKKDDHFYLKHRFYIPESTIAERYRKEHIGIIDWVQQGIVTALPGSTIDYDYIFTDLQEDALHYKLKIIAYDPYHARDLIKKSKQNCPILSMCLLPRGCSTCRRQPRTLKNSYWNIKL
jgi:phage terminase large subunit-like protein